MVLVVLFEWDEKPDWRAVEADVGNRIDRIKHNTRHRPAQILCVRIQRNQQPLNQREESERAVSCSTRVLAHRVTRSTQYLSFGRHISGARSRTVLLIPLLAGPGPPPPLPHAGQPAQASGSRRRVRGLRPDRDGGPGGAQAGTCSARAGRHRAQARGQAPACLAQVERQDRAGGPVRSYPPNLRFTSHCSLGRGVRRYVRLQFKIGFYDEFRQDWRAAVSSYRDAYDQLTASLNQFPGVSGLWFVVWPPPSPPPLLLACTACISSIRD
jgi:hypothetical protein